ncbi:MAG: PP2C family protein-serine/threonine phosphatase [Acidobacteriota bacterium]
MASSKSGLPRMAGYTIVSAAVFLVGLAASTFLPGNILGALEDIGALALFVSAGYYIFRAFVWIKKRLLWKVRNKIIVSFAFVGIIPIIILLIIASTVLIIMLKRVSGFYLEHELGVITETLDGSGRVALLAYLRQSERSQAAARNAAEEGLRGIPFGLRHAVFFLYRRSETGEAYRWVETVQDPDNSSPSEPPPMQPWVRDGFSGLTRQGMDISFSDVVDLDSRTRLLIDLPFDQRTVDYLKRRTSLEVVLTRAPRENPSFQQVYASLGDAEQGFSIHWANPFMPVAWATGRPAELWSIALSVPLRTLLEYFFDQGTGPLIVLLVFLGILFVGVEFVSLVIGFAIARGITQSIHDIYSAVQSIQAGNFEVQIPSRRKDQLDNVAESLNEMSTSIVRLMGEVAKRESIEKELEIAKEVQNQLFPQQLPAVAPLEIAASCSPARQVSGDYYDFLTHGTGHLDIVVGDISGKGISAALLMASLQSTIRSGLGELNGDPRARIAQVVRNVNRQLYRRSSPESYSTLVLSHFDASLMRLYYCNAGHHPPLHFSEGRVSGLTVGGTVVGLFENWDFEAGEVTLCPGDLLLYFTDGVVEAANAEGEQFGTDRVTEIVRQNLFLTAEDIQRLLLDEVFEWTGEADQADDITVVCMKVAG